MLAVVDGSDEMREAAIAGADLFASIPGLQFTLLAPADVAQPTGNPEQRSEGTVPNGSGTLLQQSGQTSTLLETTREIEDRGLTTRLRTVEGDLVERAAEIARTHDLVILPASMSESADEFSVPALLAP